MRLKKLIAVLAVYIVVLFIYNVEMKTYIWVITVIVSLYLAWAFYNVSLILLIGLNHQEYLCLLFLCFLYLCDILFIECLDSNPLYSFICFVMTDMKENNFWNGWCISPKYRAWSVRDNKMYEINWFASWGWLIASIDTIDYWRKYPWEYWDGVFILCHLHYLTIKMKFDL